MHHADQKDSRIKPVILMALLTAVSLFGDSMLYIVLPIHWKEVGLASLVEVGILLSANRLIRLPLNPVYWGNEWLRKGSKKSFRKTDPGVAGKKCRKSKTLSL